MLKNNQESYCCRVCGLKHDPAPWGDDGNTPIFELCICCGVQFGYEDCMPEGVKRYRKIWFDRKNKWFIPKKMPADWSLERQMKNIPEDYR